MKKKLIVLFSAMALLLGACGGSVEHASGAMKVDGGELILGEYKNLKVDKVTYTVSDADVDSAIENDLEDYKNDPIVLSSLFKKSLSYMSIGEQKIYIF